MISRSDKRRVWYNTHRKQKVASENVRENNPALTSNAFYQPNSTFPPYLTAEQFSIPFPQATFEPQRVYQPPQGQGYLTQEWPFNVTAQQFSVPFPQATFEPQRIYQPPQGQGHLTQEWPSNVTAQQFSVPFPQATFEPQRIYQPPQGQGHLTQEWPSNVTAQQFSVSFPQVTLQPQRNYQPPQEQGAPTQAWHPHFSAQQYPATFAQPMQLTPQPLSSIRQPPQEQAQGPPTQGSHPHFSAQQYPAAFAQPMQLTPQPLLSIHQPPQEQAQGPPTQGSHPHFSAQQYPAAFAQPMQLTPQPLSSIHQSQAEQEQGRGPPTQEWPFQSTGEQHTTAFAQPMQLTPQPLSSIHQSQAEQEQACLTHTWSGCMTGSQYPELYQCLEPYNQPLSAPGEPPRRTDAPTVSQHVSNPASPAPNTHQASQSHGAEPVTRQSLAQQVQHTTTVAQEQRFKEQPSQRHPAAPELPKRDTENAVPHHTEQGNVAEGINALFTSSKADVEAELKANIDQPPELVEADVSKTLAIDTPIMSPQHSRVSEAISNPKNKTPFALTHTEQPQTPIKQPLGSAEKDQKEEIIATKAALRLCSDVESLVGRHGDDLTNKSHWLRATLTPDVLRRLAIKACWDTDMFKVMMATVDIPLHWVLVPDTYPLHHRDIPITPKTTNILYISHKPGPLIYKSAKSSRYPGHWSVIHLHIESAEWTATVHSSHEDESWSQACKTQVDAVSRRLGKYPMPFNSITEKVSMGCDGWNCGPIAWEIVKKQLRGNTYTMANNIIDLRTGPLLDLKCKLAATSNTVPNTEVRIPQAANETVNSNRSVRPNTPGSNLSDKTRSSAAVPRCGAEAIPPLAASSTAYLEEEERPVNPNAASITKSKPPMTRRVIPRPKIAVDPTASSSLVYIEIDPSSAIQGGKRTALQSATDTEHEDAFPAFPKRKKPKIDHTQGYLNPTLEHNPSITSDRTIFDMSNWSEFEVNDADHKGGARALHASLTAMDPTVAVGRVIRAVVDQMSNDDRDSEHTFAETQFPAKQLAWAAKDIGYELRVVVKEGRRYYASQILSGNNSPVYVLEKGEHHWVGLHPKDKLHERTDAILTAAPSRNTRSKARKSIEKKQTTGKTQTTLPYGNTSRHQTTSDQPRKANSATTRNAILVQRPQPLQPSCESVINRRPSTVEQENQPSLVESPAKSSTQTQRVKCKFPDCSAVMTHEGLYKHVRQIHFGYAQPKTRECVECEERFYRVRDMETHMTLKHGYSDGRGFVCECGKKFTDKTPLRTHQNRNCRIRSTQTDKETEGQRKGQFKNPLPHDFIEAIKKSYSSPSTEQSEGDEVTAHPPDHDDSEDLLVQNLFEATKKYGYGDILKSAIMIRNNSFVEYHSSVLSNSSITKNGIDSLPNLNETRLCFGVGEGVCEFNATVTTETAILILHNTAMRLPRRCLLCDLEQSKNRKGSKRRHLKSVNTDCVIQQSIARIYVGPHEKVRRLLGLPLILTKSRYAKPMYAERDESMKNYLDNTTILLPRAWDEVHLMMTRKDPDLFFFDTEFAGTLLCEIGIVNSEGKVVLDTIVEHGKTCDQLIKEFSINHIATMGILKFYGPKRQATSMMTLEALATKIEELGVGYSTTFVEWSTNNCDWHRLYDALHEVGKEPLMPPMEQSLKAINFLKADLFKDLETCSLPHLYPLIFPTCALRHQSHNAAVDAIKLYNVMNRVLNLKKNPTTRWTQPANADTD